MRNKLLFLTLLEGGLVMLLETASPIVVAPVLGHSVMVWATMLSLSVGALALGYFLGGWFTRKERDFTFLMRLFSINGLVILAGWTLLKVQNNSSADLVTPLFSYLISAIVLFVPLLLFGSSTPVIIALLQEKKSDSAVTGKIFSLSTIGGILFSFITGYFLIDLIGVSKTILVAAFLCVLVPFQHYLKDRKSLFFGVNGIIILVSLFFLFKTSSLSSSKDLKVLHFSEGISGQLIVADYKQKEETIRVMLINRMGQTQMNLNTNFSTWPYVNYLTSAASMYPAGSNTLVLGLGGGIVPKQISYFLGHNVDAVELDHRIVSLSEIYFNFWKARINIYTDDARRFVKIAPKKYDFIVLDIFNGEIMPSHGLSKEAFEDIDRILKPNGLIAINFNGFLSGKEGIAGRSLLRTLKSAGFKVDLFDCGGGLEKESERNMLYFAYKQAPNWSGSKTHTLVEGKEIKIGEKLMKPSDIPKGESYIITDDYPILEFINRYAADSWRKSYLENFTKKFHNEYRMPLVK